MKQFNHFLLDLLFPPVCLSCNKIGDSICPTCREKLQKLNSSICPFCLQNSDEGIKHQNCHGSIDSLVSVYKYNKILQKIIKSIKYRFYYSALDDLLNIYFEDLKQIKNLSFYKFLMSKPILIPIPLHPKRLQFRGFNQSEIIAKFLSQKFNLPISTQIILRSKNTLFQSELKKADRQTNIQNAFSPTPKTLSLNKGLFKNHNLLLIDDVWTTGSTCQEAAKTLKKIGFNQIWVLTLAR